MNIKNWFLNLRRRFTSQLDQATVAREQSGATGPAAISSLQREIAILGEEKSARQRFYEQWAARQEWIIHSEGLPLLLGRRKDSDPATGPDDSYFMTLWEHLQRCAGNNMAPKILNPADPAEAWRAEPVELYKWALAARVNMPEELEALLGFISSVVKQVPQAGADTSVKEAGSAPGEAWSSKSMLAREQVLSALLSVALSELAGAAEDYPALRERMIESLYRHAVVLFANLEPPLSRPAIHDLIDRSMESAAELTSR